MAAMEPDLFSPFFHAGTSSDDPLRDLLGLMAVERSRHGRRQVSGMHFRPPVRRRDQRACETRRWSFETWAATTTIRTIAVGISST